MLMHTNKPRLWWRQQQQQPKASLLPCPVVSAALLSKQQQQQQEEKPALPRERKTSHESTVNLDKDEEWVLGDEDIIISSFPQQQQREDKQSLQGNKEKQNKHVRFSPGPLPSHPDHDLSDLNVQVHEIPSIGQYSEFDQWAIWFQAEELESIVNDSIEEIQDAVETMQEIMPQDCTKQDTKTLLSRLLLAAMVSHPSDDQRPLEDLAQKMLDALLFQGTHNVYHQYVRGLEADLLVLQLHQQEQKQQQQQSKSRRFVRLVQRLVPKSSKQRTRASESLCSSSLPLNLPARHVQAVLRAQKRHMSVVAAAAPTSRASARLARVYAAYDEAVAKQQQGQT